MTTRQGVHTDSINNTPARHGQDWAWYILVLSVVVVPGRESLDLVAVLRDAVPIFTSGIVPFIIRAHPLITGSG